MLIIMFKLFKYRKVAIAPGSGGILSTANDMAIYMDFHLNYGKVGNTQVVPDVMRD